MPAPYSPITPVLMTGNGVNLLTWPIVIGATSYSVQRSLDSITWLQVGTPTVPAYLDSSVTVGLEYYYQVAALNGVEVSAYTASYPELITPCLPGQINLGYIRYQAQLRADKLNSEYLTKDEWNVNINNSIGELYDILTTKYGDDYFMAPPLLIPLTGLASYPIPDGSNYSGAPALFKLLGVDTNIPGAAAGPNAGWVPMARANWSDRDRFTAFPGQTGSLNNVYQASYRPMGNQIYVFPANQNMLMQLWYVPIFTQLLKDTDMLSYSFSAWVEYIIVDAAMKAMIKEESFEKWNVLNESKNQQILRIETTAPGKDIGQPNTVSNVRAVMGDPGFSNWGSGFGSGGFGSIG